MDYGVSPIYVERLLNVLSRLSPPLCYLPLRAIGHKFRNWKTYSASGTEPGVLFHALEMVKHSLGLEPKKARALINDFLRFESRYLLENYWMIRREYSKIERAFSPKARTDYVEHLGGGQKIVVVIHTANVFLMASLAQIYGLNTCTMVGEIPHSVPTDGNPIYRHGMKMIFHWNQWQFLIPPSAKRAVDMVRRGHSLIIAADLPGYNGRGGRVPFLGLDIWVPMGAVKLANMFGLPIVMAVSWAGTCIERYNIAFERLEPSGDVEADLKSMFKRLEKIVMINPSCWLGWLCLHQMVAR